MKYLTLISRIVLGGVLIFAGIVKYPNIGSLIWEIEQYEILPYALILPYGVILPPLEIVLGIFLLLGLELRTSASISGLVVLSFTIAKVSALIRGLEIDICECFGPAIPLLLVQSLAIDFVMLALAILLIFKNNRFLSLDSWLSAKSNH